MNQDHFDCMEFFLENTFGAVNVQFIEEPLFGRAYSLYAGRTIGDDEHLIVVTSGLRHTVLRDPRPIEEKYKRAELMIKFPSDWIIGSDDDRDCSWLVEWFDVLVDYIRKGRVCINQYAIFANEEPAKPLGFDTHQSCLLALGVERMGFEIVDEHGNEVMVYTLIPLYAEERDMERKYGLNSVLDLFDEHNLSEVVDLRRINVALAPQKWS